MKFELVTPQQLLTSEENVKHVACPGEEGDFGVLPGHMAFVSTLRKNATVSVTDATGKTTHYTVDGGFAEVTANSVTVLAEHAEAQ